jgi:DNA-directed RNA polymerase specialized sigma24 family protein
MRREGENRSGKQLCGSKLSSHQDALLNELILETRAVQEATSALAQRRSSRNKVILLTKNSGVTYLRIATELGVTKQRAEQLVRAAEKEGDPDAK